ncbi:polysaccharide biosynthesis tyrosine autokinase [Agarivorans sp. TSD2052]|uniref:GumC family protein n=1 Tax=Agarivorans sp. TSD2052 TaxID=2937286 RepID=UPI00200DC858|nr:polysaccharide biosynthesis tyrosine autokinase [Agarivorans sp. TSD2052]UPW18276.1 polysaccharide biosynthesis tyrosine autokinase [Agarivorans sp. TSD2052]
MNKHSSINVHHIDNDLINQQIVAAKRFESNEELIDLGQYFIAVLRYWPMIIGFTFIVGLLATLIAFSITPVYRATAVLLIEAEQRNAVSIAEVIGVDTSKQEYYLTQFELLKSRTIAQKVIDKYKLGELAEFNGQKELTNFDKLKNPIGTLRGYAQESVLVQSWLPPQQAASDLDMQEALSQRVMAEFRKRLIVSPIRKTQLVNISFESGDKRLAAALANAVGEAYIENNRDAHLQASQEATTWLEDRLTELKTAVTFSENRLTGFLEREGLVDVSGIDSLASAELSDISRRLSDARDRRVAAESLFYVLQDNRNAGIAQLSSISAISNHPQLRDVRLAEIEAERLVSELSKRYGPKHDKMIQAQAQLASVKDRTRKVLNSLATGIEKELNGARKQENAIQAELNGKKDQFQGIAVKRATYDALKREVESNRKLYDLFLNRQKETMATMDFQPLVARFSDLASVPLVPAKPRKMAIIVISALVSFVFTIFFSLICHSAKNTIESVSDIQEKLHLAPLGSIPLLKGRQFAKMALLSEAYFNKKFNHFSEAVRSIRTSLLLNMAGKERSLIAVSSAVPGEGKTTVSINLALSMAQMEKTLLIDCDLRRPSVGKRFGLKVSHLGLSNLILMGSDMDECIYLHEKSGLSVLPAGMLVPNAQELLASQKFIELIASLEKHYDKIIFDTPPVVAVSDALILGKIAGGCALVIGSGTTKLKQLNGSIAKFVDHSIPIDGVILNRTVAKSSEDYGYYGYSS